MWKKKGGRRAVHHAWKDIIKRKEPNLHLNLQWQKIQPLKLSANLGINFNRNVVFYEILSNYRFTCCTFA